MNTLATLIDSAVAAAIAEHPKLFEPKAVEGGKTQRVITREIMRTLTRVPGEDPKPEAAPEPEPFERVLAADERGRAYLNLRIAARAPLPDHMRLPGGDIMLPREASGPEVLPFARMPAKEQWVLVSEPAPLAAWRDHFAATLPNLERRPFGEGGVMMPWPWPPSKTGKIYEPETEGAAE